MHGLCQLSSGPCPQERDRSSSLPSAPLRHTLRSCPPWGRGGWSVCWQENEPGQSLCYLSLPSAPGSLCGCPGALQLLPPPSSQERGFQPPLPLPPPSTASSVGRLTWLRLPRYQQDGLRPCFLRAQSAEGNSHLHDPAISPVPSAQVRVAQQVPCVRSCPFCRQLHLSWGSPSVGLEGWGRHPSGVFGRRERPQCPP